MWARASRTAVSTASVPETTKRTRSAGLKASSTFSASCTSWRWVVPKARPSRTAFSTAAMTFGWQWPSTSGPQAMQKST